MEVFVKVYLGMPFKVTESEQATIPFRDGLEHRLCCFRRTGFCAPGTGRQGSTGYCNMYDQGLCINQGKEKLASNAN